VLDEADLALLIRVCRDHVVASCEKCQKSYTLVELAYAREESHGRQKHKRTQATVRYAQIHN
jgi:hypothetical protein